ncbi:MAG: winged helix-turn-helix domain-containing protein [Caldilineaceae bacterium]
MNPQTILFVENDTDYREALSEILAGEGYRVLEAPTIDVAWRHLRRTNIHLAIVDVRMTPESSPDDDSGLVFARDDRIQMMPKIILTAYPSRESMRHMVRPTPDTQPPAIDYLAKDDGADAILEAIANAFDEWVRINRQLPIRWRDQIGSFTNLATLIDPNPAGDMLGEMSAALEDLFRRMFRDSAQVTIGRTLARRGQRVFLEVEAHPHSGGTEQCIVVCGERRQVLRELELHERYAPKTVSTGDLTAKTQVDGVHFAAVEYEPVGIADQQVASFRDYYHRHTAPEIQAAIDQLYNGTLRRWHAGDRDACKGDEAEAAMRKWYRYAGEGREAEQWRNIVDFILDSAMHNGLAHVEPAGDRIRLALPDGSELSFPRPYLPQPCCFQGLATICAAVHGNVDVDSLLMSPRGLSWLLDFGDAGAGPVLVDYVRFECQIAVDLVEGVDVGEWCAFMANLLDADSLDAEFGETANPILQKAYAAIAQIRGIAMALVDKDIRPYLVGLYACHAHRMLGIERNIHYSPAELTPYFRSMLAAGHLRQRIEDATTSREGVLRPNEAQTGLWLDEDARVAWVDGQLVELTQQDYKLLRYLTQHPGAVCERKDLVEQALEEPFEDLETERGRINAAMHRLIVKIEPAPEARRYIHTVAGHGYRFVP